MQESWVVTHHSLKDGTRYKPAREQAALLAREVNGGKILVQNRLRG